MVKQNKNEIEYDRIQIAKLQYSNSLRENKSAEYKNSSGENVRIGTVREVVTDDFGQKAYVIQSVDKKEV
ncbi:hypothetical protein MXZ21_05480 [Streptococcus uberis]|uniref:hypothetical protein n=1 Tax=Streptococcus uberis TaxID=1349 RepID=UPI00193AD9A9|nr:hypothetical protein [Streptococcus uberis]MCK1191243.1 hypothetical protein [Streptococcus uberis]MCK1209799.1 hypothetical protein [Streptococcus uberis]MCK1248214.1 hypothetical protein [Streptococcus uberis]